MRFRIIIIDAASVVARVVSAALVVHHTYRGIRFVRRVNARADKRR